jgi:glyoxylase-like metal-dependent hydrolase (beta-lactamase superfamily II)
MLERDLQLIHQHGLHLKYVVETHTHADHITSATALAAHTGAVIATSAICGAKASRLLHHHDVLLFGGFGLQVLHTPGHTAGSLSFYLTLNHSINANQTSDTLNTSHVFTGDTLLINGCGRTDFQSGNPQDLYRSITQVLFALPDDTKLWVGHDYAGNTQSTIGLQKRQNARLIHDGELCSEATFIDTMNCLQLAPPKRIHEAVPANLALGARNQ